MDNWITSPTYLSDLRGAQAGALGEGEVPPTVLDFLTRLRLLYGVPFNHLVADSRLLPPESVRFFYIDRNFTDRLVDGALSVGKTTTREFAHAQASNNTVRAEADEHERNLRSLLRNPGASKETGPQTADLSGLLMRSRAVSGWPGVEVKAYQNITTAQPQGKPLRLLRMDRLAPDVLLCIFHGVPTRIDVEEPREGIQFGVDLVVGAGSGEGVVQPSTETPSGFRLTLRHLGDPLAGQPLGTVDGNPPTLDDPAKTVAVPVRKANRRVLHVQALRATLQNALIAGRQSEHRLQCWDPTSPRANWRWKCSSFRFASVLKATGAPGTA